MQQHGRRRVRGTVKRNSHENSFTKHTPLDPILINKEVGPVAYPGVFLERVKKTRGGKPALNFFIFRSIKTSKNQIVNVAGQIAQNAG